MDGTRLNEPEPAMRVAVFREGQGVVKRFAEK
jgi:hypothetical protein